MKRGIRIEVDAPTSALVELYSNDHKLIAQRKAKRNKKVVFQLSPKHNIALIQTRNVSGGIASITYRLWKGNTILMSETASVGSGGNLVFDFADDYLRNLFKQLKPSLWTRGWLHMKENWHKYTGLTNLVIKLLEYLMQHLMVTRIYSLR